LRRADPRTAFSRLDARRPHVHYRQESRPFCSTCRSRGRPADGIEDEPPYDLAAALAAIPFAGPAALARRIKIDARSVRYWLDGGAKPSDPRKVALEVRAIVAEAAPILFGKDRDTPAEDFCRDLPAKADIVRASWRCLSGCWPGARAV
jgi:hypothetical protein